MSDDRLRLVCPKCDYVIGVVPVEREAAQVGQGELSLPALDIDGGVADAGAVALHARSLTFLHPVSKEPITLTADVTKPWKGRFAHLMRDR